MLNGIFQCFATQHVNVQMLTAFNAHFRFDFHWDFAVLNLTQFINRNNFIFCKACFCTYAARFAFFAVQQPERVQQVVVCSFSNLDTSNHVMSPLNYTIGCCPLFRAIGKTIVA